MMFSGMTFCLIVYMVLPNGLDIRPMAEEVGRSNIAMTLMQLIWKADASVNVCPSIHCQSSACMAIAFSGSTLAREKEVAQDPGLRLGCPHLRLYRLYQAALHHRRLLRAGRGAGLGAGALSSPPEGVSFRIKYAVFAVSALDGTAAHGYNGGS